MHPDKFGDSYDIVKQSILEWLRPCGTWAAHPMFSKDFSQSFPSFAEEYKTFLGSCILSPDPVPPYSGEIPRVGKRWDTYLAERDAYFREAKEWDCTDHLFLDPDTGFWLPKPNSAKQPPPPRKEEPQYLMAKELLDIAKARPDKLVLVFDQSFSRNLVEKERQRKTEEKLRWLAKHRVYGVAYLSHANFVLASACKEVLDNAHRTLLQKSKLPKKRIVQIQGASE